MAATQTSVRLEQEADYRFEVQVAPAAPPFFADEPPPLGKGSGPSPVQLLAAAVGTCLSDSLLFALRKFKQSAEPLSTVAEATVGRNEANRLRVQAITVKLSLGVPADALEHLDRVLVQFEDFCTVTQSVRLAFPVEVEVYDATGRRLK
jgi:uncharacterized OsmC-like protein